MSNRKNIMLCYPFEEKRLDKWNIPVIVQPKLDGFRCRALFKPDGVELLSSEENSLNFAVPHIPEYLWKHRNLFTSNGIYELDGELYIHGATFEGLSSILKRTDTRHEHSHLMQYHIFDHVCAETECARRLIEVENLILDHLDNPIHTVPFRTTIGVEGIMDILNEYTTGGYEGVIVSHPYAPYERKRSTYIMKWKPRKKDNYKIIDYTEELDINGKPKGRLGAFIVQDPEGNMFKVGTGFTEAQRIRFWDTIEYILGKECTILYQHTSNGGVPRFPVFSVIVE